MFNDYIKNLSNSSDYTSALTTILVLIFILIMYLVVFKIGVYGIGKFMDWKGDPYIFHGMVPAPLEHEKYDDYKHVYTNPMDQVNETENTKSIVILRSKDERGGVEFTWALWIYVDADRCMKEIATKEKNGGLCSPSPTGAATEVETTNGRNEKSTELAKISQRNLFHIFNKGSYIEGNERVIDNPDIDIEQGMAIMTCPGLYMRYNDETTSNAYLTELRRRKLREMDGGEQRYDKLDDDLTLVSKDQNVRDNLRNSFEYVITCNTMSDINLMETITVPNIPLNLWTYVVIRCVNHKMDVYINGRIKKRAILSDMPRQNYGDLYICERNKDTLSFNGRLSGFRYFNYALQGRTIEYFTEKGPSLKPEKRDKNKDDGMPYYLTQRWHYQDYMR